MARVIRMPDEPIKESDFKSENSPHLLDLNKPAKSPVKKNTDIVRPESEKQEFKIIAQKTSPFRRSELLRMGAVAVMVVLCLNIGQVYFKAQETKQEILNAAQAGYEALLEIDPTNLEETSNTFDYALYQFELAENMVWYLTDLDSNKHIKAADSLLGSASSIASAGQLFTEFAKSVTEISDDLLQEDSEGKPSLTEALNEAFNQYLNPAYDELKRAEIYLEDVDPKVLPSEYEEKVILAKTYITDLNAFLEKLTINFPLILELLGDAYPQKYMILLENNSELRPGGGFIGSFLTLDLNDGYIDDMQFHDIYDWDGPFNEYIEPPVEEIAYLTCCWGLRDANYSPDYAVSAETVAWFFEHEGGPTVDHVMMVDLSFVRDILDVVGPVYVPTLGGELDSQNFELVLSYYVESKIHGYDDPKGILEEIIPVVQEKIMNGENLVELGQVLIDAVKGKHLAAYSQDETLQEFWQSLNVDAGTYTPSEDDDYLMVTVSGIGGNKTDHYILQNINHQTLLSKDGSILDKVTITRKHTYDINTELWQMDTLSSFGFDTISEDVRNILGAGDNVAGIRIYVPNGSELIDSSEEFELLYDEDINLPYFYTTITTPPGEETQIEITYGVPQTLVYEPVDDYFLYVDKQPGLDNTTFTKQIIAPNLNNYALYPEELEEQEDLTYHYETSLDQNLHLGGVFGD